MDKLLLFMNEIFNYLWFKIVFRYSFLIEFQVNNDKSLSINSLSYSDAYMCQ